MLGPSPLLSFIGSWVRLGARWWHRPLRFCLRGRRFEGADLDLAWWRAVDMVSRTRMGRRFRGGETGCLGDAGKCAWERAALRCADGKLGARLGGRGLLRYRAVATLHAAARGVRAAPRRGECASVAWGQPPPPLEHLVYRGGSVGVLDAACAGGADDGVGRDRGLLGLGVDEPVGDPGGHAGRHVWRVDATLVAVFDIQSVLANGSILLNQKEKC